MAGQVSYVPVLNNGACPCLGGNGLGDDVSDIMAKLTSDMKKLALEQAAINTAIIITLDCIPVIGWATILLVEVGQIVLGAYYKDQVKKVIAAFQREIALMGASYTQKVADAQNAAFEQEKQAGIDLALSGQVTADAGVSGLGHWQDFLAKAVHFFSNPMRQLHPILRAEHVVFQDMNDVIARCPVPAIRNMAKELNKQDSKAYADTLRVQNAIDSVIDQSTGEAGLKKAQEAVSKARAAAIREFEAQTTTAIDNINSPPFRQQLRVEIAKQILSDKSVAGLVAQKLALTTQGANAIVGVNATGYQAPSAKLTVLPAVGTAAVVLLFAGMGSK